MSKKQQKFKEPKYLIQPYDNSEYYFKIAKEFKGSQKDPTFTTLNYQDWLKKYKKRYGVSGNTAFEPMDPSDKR